VISRVRFWRHRKTMKRLALQVSAGVLSVNEARARLGLEPIHDERAYQPLGH
jgi:hypothetical protein